MSDEPNQLRKPVVAVHRAVAILRYLGGASAPAGVQEVARALDIVPSTCLHILRSLVHEGMLTVDPASKRYRLGPAVLRLARDMARSDAFVQAVQPRLDRVSSAFNVTAAAATLDGPDRIIIVATSQVSPSLGISVRVGSRFPAMVSAIGMCLAARDDSSRGDYARRIEALTWQNPPAFAQWTAAVERARRDGYAVDHGYFIEGMTVVAVPVLDLERRPSRFVAALGFSRELEGEAGARLGATLTRAAAELSDVYDAA